MLLDGTPRSVGETLSKCMTPSRAPSSRGCGSVAETSAGSATQMTVFGAMAPDASIGSLNCACLFGIGDVDQVEPADRCDGAGERSQILQHRCRAGTG